MPRAFNNAVSHYYGSGINAQYYFSGLLQTGIIFTQVVKGNKNIKIIINYFLGPLLFIWLTWSIVHQIKAQPNLDLAWLQIKQAFSNKKILFLIGAILLVPLNWGLEAYKWMLAIKPVQPVSFKKAYKAILTGVAFAISTPNSVGDYAGKAMYINEGKRIKAVSLTVVANLSQLIVTMIMGTIALFFIKEKVMGYQILSLRYYYLLLGIALLICVILTIIFFRLSLFIKIINKLPFIKKIISTTETINQLNATQLAWFLSISVTRFIIFSIQYFLLFSFFGVDITLTQCWAGISVMFLLMAMIPTLALVTDVGLKNGLSIKLIGLFSANSLGISLTTLSIWFINLVFPALIGTVLILGFRNIIKVKNESN